MHVKAIVHVQSEKNKRIYSSVKVGEVHVKAVKVKNKFLLIIREMTKKACMTTNSRTKKKWPAISIPGCLY